MNPAAELGSQKTLGISLNNLKQEGIGMTLVHIPVSACMEINLEQLIMLKDKGQIDHYEIRENQLVLYWTSLKAQETKSVTLTLTKAFDYNMVSASVGSLVQSCYESPVYSYLYYDMDAKSFEKVA